MTGHKQTTDGQSYVTGYVYNLAGALVGKTYPGGRRVKNSFDSSGELSMVRSGRCLDAVAGTDGSCTNRAGLFEYAKHFSYTAAGAVAAMRLGNGLWESTQFNSRLQPVQIGLGTSVASQNLLKLNYDYGTNDNNGNVLSQQITVQRSNQSPLVFTQSYVYDSLNRLKSAEEKDAANVTTWWQTYTFDRYGNRRFDEPNTTFPSFANPSVTNPTIDETNNRFATGQGWTYDLAGNVITDAEGRSFNYDAENKQVAATNASGATLGTYYFDGDGKRVKKVVPSTGETTVFVYDASNKLVAEYSTIVEPTSTAKTSYLTNDHLGSPRILTDATGQVISRRDFLPFGEEIGVDTPRTTGANGQLIRTTAQGYGVSDTIRQKFTGYERDAETDLDFAQARMYNKSHGRFTSPDEPFLDQFEYNPQSWNLYTYTRNNPLNFIDPTGEAALFAKQRCPPDCQEVITLPNETVEVSARVGGLWKWLKKLFKKGDRDPDPPQQPQDSWWERLKKWWRGEKDEAKPNPAPNPQTQPAPTLMVERKSVDDILKGAKPGRKTKGKSKQMVKNGGNDQANKDFDDLAPSDVKHILTNYGTGRTGILPDGRTVTVRPGSSGPDSRPTLEIRNPNNQRGYEIRYDP